MQIISLYIENFGVLHEYRLEPHAGLSVICENNGFGKTTLAAFIKAMLYGLPNTRKSDLDENERKKYQPWQGGAFGGTMTFRAGGKEYRAERFFAVSGSRTKNDTFVLYDLSDNCVTDDYSENLGLELFGIDADGFARSAFLSQRVMEGGVDNATITAKLNNILDADDDVGRYEAAAALLDKSRQYYKRQGGRGRIAELEEALSQMRVQEEMCLEAARQCGEYTKSVENIDAALREIRVKHDAVAEQEQQLSEIRTKAAVTAHGRTLLSERDALLVSAAEKQRFLGEDADMQALDREIAAAENTEKKIAIHNETIRQTENKREEVQKQLSALLAIDGFRTDAAAETAGGYAADSDTDADADALRFHAPDDAVLAEIRTARDALVYARYAKEQAVITNTHDHSGTGIADIPDSVPECLSDDELERHMKQAAVYASVCETLAQPKVYAAEKERVFAASGLAEAAALPDETKMDAYADGLRHLQANAARRKTVSGKQKEDEEALRVLTGGDSADAAFIPDKDMLVSMRTLYDGLAAEKQEIDALEEKQHTAAAERLRAHRRKRISVGMGVFLLICTVLFLVLHFMNRDIRLLTASGMTAVPGILFLLYGIFGFGDSGNRVLDDDMFKRLCEKKSGYENNKTAVYEFLDRYADGAVLDTDTAEQIFKELSVRCRRMEELRAALDNARVQIERLDGEDADTRAHLLSLRQDGAQPGGVIQTDTEDEESFAEYRETVRACRKTAEDAAREAKERADCRARAGALRQTLDAYLAALAETPAAQYLPEHEEITGDGYLACLHLWKTAADTLRSRIAAKRDTEEAYTDAQT
ncbi:MAG: AAA family ATPase, partial [Eubacteriales bacterium]